MCQATKAARLALLFAFTYGFREIAADRLKMVASRLIDFMQARTGLTTESVSLLAVEVLKVQYDAVHIVRKAGERMQCLRRAAPAIDGTANLERQVLNVLRLVTIF